jgi:hypothetical protein
VCRAEARPRPVLGPRDQAGTPGMALEVAHQGDPVLVVWDSARLEPTWPHVAAVALVFPRATHVHREQPVHPTRRSPSARGLRTR